ncbi:MAG: efflux RND transporter periplasmic adaptor subunit [Schwartzia sp.]|nr:efflux RND transporter periplasmic adaptor subunit [Schwartzia sp. (in: firmicutes)]
MKRYFFIGIAVILVLALALVAYGTWLNVSDEKQIARRMDERALTLTGALAQKRGLRPVVKMDAVRLYSENMADAVALVDGRIIEMVVTKNSAVHKGDLLMRLENDQIPLKIQQATANVRRTEAGLAQAANAYHRQERLMAKEATSQEKYEEAQAQYKAAQEALAESEAQLAQMVVQEKRQNVISPVDGNVLLIYQREGSYVQGGTPLVLVGDFNRLLFSVTLDDKYTRHLSMGEAAELQFPVQALNKAYDTEYAAGNQGKAEKIVATITEITPPLSEPAGIRRVVCAIDNRARVLEPLTYNGVKLRTEREYACLTVPLAAMADASHEEVFVVNPDGMVSRREIVAGANDGRYIEILSGLSEGEAVVIESFDGLEDGLKVDVSIEEKSMGGKGDKS